MSAKRFRIAFSFAGEKRDFVKQVADLLAKRFDESVILYDKYHEAEFANANLAFDLPSLYKDEADLIVSVFCPDYDTKEWCGLEWRAIFSMIKEGTVKQIMLTRFEHTDGKGLHGLGGFIELDHKTPEQAATLILERLAINEGNPKDHYTRPAASAASSFSLQPSSLYSSIPHNLPALQPFFGREDELRKIAEALEPGTRTWGALIDGPGGMGKTSLAVRAAHDCTPEQFERIAFVSLKSRVLDDDGVRDLSGFLISGLNELFNELADRLGHKDIAKEPEDKRPRLLLSALESTRTLLILDNLESLLKTERDTVFSFVERLPSGCKAILTARGRIGTGGKELILEKLSQDAALATLAKLAEGNSALAKTSEAERIVLYTQTGGKPLLLRWTAGQIGRGSCVTFTDAIAHLRSCPVGNDPLEFIFGDLVADFSEPETHALCALTYFNLPAKLEHICSTMNPFVEPPERQAAMDALFKLLNKTAPEKPKATVSERVFSEAEVDKALRSLVNRSLVVPSEEFQTFTLVPLVADFLRKKRPEIVTETGDRLDRLVYALVEENGYDKHDRFSVLEAAWPSIAAALPRFLAGDNERLQTVCDALGRFLEFTGRVDERLALSLDAERCAVAAGDFPNAGWQAYHAGSVHHLRGQSREVLACAERAEAYFRRAKADVRNQAIAISLRGLGHLQDNDFPAAIAAFRNALELTRSAVHLREDEANGLNNIARAERLSGDFVAAERDFREALRIARVINDHEGIAIYTSNLVLLALDRQDWDGAETLASEALDLCKKVNRQELISENSRHLASALLRQGKKAEALPHAQRAVEICHRLGHRDLAKAQKILAECKE